MNTRKTIIILIMLASVLAITLFIWSQFPSAPEQNGSTEPGGVTFPNSADTPPDQTGSSTNIVSFLDAPETYADPENPGIYYLGYQPSDTTTSPFLIEYIEESNFFNVSITQEPIGESRLAAEKYLMMRLGLTREQMCGLPYLVSVSDDVNSQYASINLGFSFCPGAVELPQ